MDNNEQLANVIVDPSLLLIPQSSEALLSAIRIGDPRLEPFKFLVSKAFAEALRDVEKNISMLRYFGPKGEMVDLRYLRNVIEQGQLLVPFRPEVVSEDLEEFQFRLVQILKDSTVASILQEEWALLQSQSWMIARVRKPFAAFTKAGAVVLEVSREAFDVAVRRTLRAPQASIVSRADKLRAVAKWIAVAGSSVSALMNPLVGILGGLASVVSQE